MGYAGQDVELKNLWTIVAERKKTGEGGLTKKGEEIARKAAIRTGSGYVTYAGETPAKVPVTGIYTSGDAQRTKQYTQLLLAEGRDPQKSPFTQDVAEPVAEKAGEVVDAIGEAIDPVGSWFDTWKVPLGLGAVVVGGMLLLGYSGMGGSVGRIVERRIK